jgi:putative DNA primase/helicase
MSRSIVLSLQRMPKNTRVAKWREQDRTKLEPLLRHIARWAADNAEAVKTACADPLIEVDGLDGRDADNWEPLLAIARVAGGTWPNRALRAALALTHDGQQADNDGTGVMLLGSIRDVFAQRRAAGHKFADQIPSKELCAALKDDAEAPWANWNRGNGMNANQVAKLLKGFGIRPINLCIGSTRPKGYRLDRFTECFDRYLGTPPENASPEA